MAADNILDNKNTGIQLDSHVEQVNAGKELNLASSTQDNILRVNPLSQPNGLATKPADGLGSTITSGSGDDRIWGGVGNDVIHGGSGQDVIDGGKGNDFIDGGNGNDILNGGDGTDVLTGGDGNDTLYGGADMDFVFGGNGNDWMDGGSGKDVVVGGDGADTLYGGADDDYLFGDDIAASAMDSVGYKPDTIFNGLNYDLLQSDTYDGNANNEDGDGKSEAGEKADTSWNDLLNGGAGDDKLWGGKGADIFQYSINGALKGNDINFSKLWGSDVINDFNGGTIVRGNPQANAGDRIDLRDFFSRISDPDVQKIMAAINIAASDQSTDPYNPPVKINGTGGIYDVNGLGGEHYKITIIRTDGDITINVLNKDVSTDTGANIKILHTPTGEGSWLPFISSNNFLLDTQKLVHYHAGIEDFDGTTLADGLVDFDTANWKNILGTKSVIYYGHDIATNANAYGRDDSVNGTKFGDSLYGLKGDDTLVGNLGNDRVDGGDGNDYLYGDTFYPNGELENAKDGNDSLYGGNGNDYLSGQGGNDQLWGGAGSDTLDGGSGNDWLYGGGNDYFKKLQDGSWGHNGDTEADYLFGNTGSDTFVIGGSISVDWLNSRAYFNVEKGKTVITDFTMVDADGAGGANNSTAGDHIKFADQFFNKNNLKIATLAGQEFIQHWEQDHIFKVGNDLVIKGDNWVYPDGKPAVNNGHWEIVLQGHGDWAVAEHDDGFGHMIGGLASGYSVTDFFVFS